MIEVRTLAAQGDVLFRRIAALPEDVVEVLVARPLVVARSETGHHHCIGDEGVRLFEIRERDPLLCYLQVDGDFADVVHLRHYDTHATLRLLPGVWEVRRQREWRLEGPRRALD